MRRLHAVLTTMAFALCATPSSFGQAEGESDLRQEIEALERGQRRMQQQLDRIEQLLRERPAPARAPSGPDVRGKVFELRGNPVKGVRTAPLTLVDFTDYQ